MEAPCQYEQFLKLSSLGAYMPRGSNLGYAISIAYCRRAYALHIFIVYFLVERVLSVYAGNCFLAPSKVKINTKMY